MIVSFVMTMLTISDRPYLWAFYKFLDMAQKNNGALIAQEEYFIDPLLLAKKGRVEAYDKAWNERCELNYDIPTQQTLDEVQKYIIPKSFEEQLIHDKGSINDANMCLLTEEIDELKVMISGFLSAIQDSNQEIDAIMTLCHIPSLSAVAAEFGIPVIHFEMGTFREPTYLKTCYFDFDCLYGSASTEKRYHSFIEEIEKNPVPIMQNQEILALLLQRDYMHYINHFNDSPKYELGIALGYTIWPLYLRNTFCDDSELLYRAGKVYPMDQLLVRKHPSDPQGSTYPRYDYCRDTSATTLDFLLKCKRIASVGSNVSFEGMLWGKTGYVLTDCPYTYKMKREIEDTSLQEFDLHYLNFYIFAYLVPFSLLWDMDYIHWRLTNPSETEIYIKHLKFYFEKKGISFDEFMQSTNHLEYLLKAQDYDLNASYAKVELKEKRVFTIRQYQNEIKRLRSLLED